MNIRSLPDIGRRVGPLTTPDTFELRDPAKDEVVCQTAIGGAEAVVAGPAETGQVAVRRSVEGDEKGCWSVLDLATGKSVDTHVPAYPHDANTSGYQPSFSPDGKRLVLKRDSDLAVVDTQTGQTLAARRTPDPYGSNRLSVQFLPQDELLLMHSDHLAEIVDGRTLATRSSQKLPFAAEAQADGSLLGLHDGRAVRLQPNDQDFLHDAPWTLSWSSPRVTRSDRAQAPVLSPDGQHVAVATADGTFVINAANGQVESINDTAKLDQGLEWSHDGRFLVGRGDFEAVVLDASSLTPVAKLESHGGKLIASGFAENGVLTAVAQEEEDLHTIFTLDPATGQETRQNVEGPGDLSVNERGAVWMRRPTEEAHVSDPSVEEWLKLYHDVARQVEKADNAFGDQDPTVGSYNGTVEMDGKRIHVESTGSNLTYEEYGDGRSFTSDGQVLQTTVRRDCTYATYSWNDTFDVASGRQLTQAYHTSTKDFSYEDRYL